MNSDSGRSLNSVTLGIFAPVLIVVGILGFVLPSHLSLTSGAPAYNVFHLVFGAIGIGLVMLKKEALIRVFCLGFGALDIYQALASYWHFFPERYFAWTSVDDVLHVVIGLALVVIGIVPGLKTRCQVSSC